ncbi:hypothetical protein BGZ63DRAFT_408273 [Mariannaea sp. PMI_226]|nr:hypothetical protein BGZ63DRAFT_408273 [Mariannaea sp. PMI_226]
MTYNAKGSFIKLLPWRPPAPGILLKKSDDNIQLNLSCDGTAMCLENVHGSLQSVCAMVNHPKGRGHFLEQLKAREQFFQVTVFNSPCHSACFRFRPAKREPVTGSVSQTRKSTCVLRGRAPQVSLKRHTSRSSSRALRPLSAGSPVLMQLREDPNSRNNYPILIKCATGGPAQALCTGLVASGVNTYPYYTINMSAVRNAFRTNGLYAGLPGADTGSRSTSSADNSLTET